MLTSCNKEELNGVTYNKYIIKNHYAKYKKVFRNDKDNVLKGKAILTNSCKYKLDYNYGQINKLTGLSLNGYHHNNSFRIGWEYDLSNDNFKLYSYVYLDSERLTELIKTVKANDVINFNIEVTKTKASITVDGIQKEYYYNVDKVKTKLLFPYFGGVEPFSESLNGDKECKILIKYN